MTVPLIVLAALSVLGGVLLLGDWIVDWLEPVVGDAPSTTSRRSRRSCITPASWSSSWPSASRSPGSSSASSEVPREAPQDVSFVTRAARADLYGDAINEALVVEPGQYLVTRPGRRSTRTVVDGAVNGRRRRGRRPRPAGPPRCRPASSAPTPCPLLGGVAARRPGPAGGEPRMNDFPWLTAPDRRCRSSARWSCRVRCPTAAAPAAQAGRARLLAAHPGRRRSSIAAQYDAGGGIQFTETHEWIEAFGAHYAARRRRPRPAAGAADRGPGADRDASRPGTTADDQQRRRSFFAWMLALEALSLGVFAATDVFLFYVLFEATLIPMYFLIGGFGRAGRGVRRGEVPAVPARRRPGACWRRSSASTSSPPTTGQPVVPAHRPGRSSTSAPTPERWLFLGFFIAFAVKAPMLPVHTWLPDTTEEATPGTSRAAGLRPRQDRHLRHAALLPGAVPRGVASGRRRS